LIQHSGGGTTGVNFAVCSLNCLPKQSQYILNLKAKLSDPSYVPPKVTIVTTSTPTLPSSPPALMPASSSGSFGTYNYSALNGELNDNGSEEFNQDIQIEGTSSLAEGTLVMNGDGTYQYQSADGSEYSVSLIPGTGTLEIPISTHWSFPILISLLIFSFLCFGIYNFRSIDAARSFFRRIRTIAGRCWCGECGNFD